MNNEVVYLMERVDFLRSICFVNILWVNWTTKIWVLFMYITAIDVGLSIHLVSWHNAVYNH